MIDHAFLPAFAKRILQFKLDDGLGHRAKRDEQRSDSKENENRIEDAPSVAERVQLQIADCADEQRDAEQSADEKGASNQNAAKWAAAHRDIPLRVQGVMVLPRSW